MSRRPLASLWLAVVLSGCGAQALKSPECDQGGQVVATGRIALADGISAADASEASIRLWAKSLDGTNTDLGTAVLEEPSDFPLPFTVCADLAGVEAGASLALIATVERAVVQARPAVGLASVSRTAQRSDGLVVTVAVNDCYCGPACDPSCGFQ